MRRQRYCVLIALGCATATAAVTSTLAVGCGGDDSLALPEAGTQDATSQSDGPLRQPDSGDGGPASSGDGAPADAGLDADGGPPSDGALEAAPPVFPPGDWSSQEARAICEGVLGCCPGGLDGGAYDLAACESVFVHIGWVTRTVPFDPSLIDGGNIAFDPDAGAACLAAMQAFPCGAQTAAYYKSTADACYGALYGLIPSGKPGCRSSWECAPGTFCDGTVDGGVCTPLVAQGQPCNTKAPRSEMCSYLGSSEPPLYCTFAEQPDASTCQPLLPDGTSCSTSDTQECASRICGADGKCGDNLAAPVPAFCNLYTIQDAGGGG